MKRGLSSFSSKSTFSPKAKTNLTFKGSKTGFKTGFKTGSNSFLCFDIYGVTFFIFLIIMLIVSLILIVEFKVSDTIIFATSSCLVMIIIIFIIYISGYLCKTEKHIDAKITDTTQTSLDTVTHNINKTHDFLNTQKNKINQQLYPTYQNYQNYPNYSFQPFQPIQSFQPFQPIQPIQPIQPNYQVPINNSYTYSPIPQNYS